MDTLVSVVGLLICALMCFTVVLVVDLVDWPLVFVIGLGCPLIYSAGFFMGLMRGEERVGGRK